MNTKAILFLMNEAKRNVLGEDFAVRTGTSQRAYLIRTIISLGIEGAKYDWNKEDYVVESGSDASAVLQSCGYFSWGQPIPQKVQSAKEFI